MIEVQPPLLNTSSTIILLCGALLVIAALLLHIKTLKRKQQVTRHLDQIYQIPNLTALRHSASALSADNKNYLYIAVWLSGLDRIEMVMGIDYYQSLFKQFITNLQKELNDKEYVYTHQLPDMKPYSAFLSEKNMLGVFLKADQKKCLKSFRSTIFRQLDLIKNEYSCNMPIRPLMTGASSDTPPKPINKVLQNSHTAMLYSYKANWEFTLYSDALEKTEHKNLVLINDFKRALEEGQLFLLWQPQLDAKTKKTVGLEALARWHHPTYGLVPPDVFIPVLEESQQITLLSCWAIGKSFEISKSLQKTLPGINLSINLSVHDLTDPTFISYLDKVTRANPGISNSITLEMTESMMMKDNDQALHFVNEIQQKGFSFSIDDFGAGYSSFGYLEAIPADELKIDKRFADTCHKKNAQIIIKSIISMAKQLSMKVVVEGIEHEAQEELFTAWGVERLQGWKYGKPMKLEALINTHTARQQ